MAGPVKFNQLFDETGPGRQELDELVKSVAALSRGVKALGKNLDTDGQRIGAGLIAITQQTQALRERTTQLTLTTEAERAALAALGTQVAELARQQQQQLAALAGQATVKKAAAAADKEAVSVLRALQKELKESYAANDTERIRKAALAVQQYKQQTDQLNKAVRGANSELTAAAGSYNRLSIETQQLGEKIRALPGGFSAASEEAKKLKKEFSDNTQKLKDFDRELNQNFREVGSYAKGILEATRALNGQKVALTGELSALKMQANATHLSAEEQRKLTAEIQRTEAELGKVSGQLQGYGVAAGAGADGTKNLGDSAKGMAEAFVAGYLGVTALAAAIGTTFQSVAEYSDQLAAVRKTTGLTAEATNALAESLKKLDTRTSLSGLLDIAKVGGQLGIAGKDIEGFTKSIDVAVQALGDDFSGGAEEIATELGKIGTVFRKQLGPDVPQGIIRIGSALNELGAAGAATAPFLADVALRTGAVAANANLGLKDVLAYAAVLQETGFTAETSGTALNRLFNTLSTRSTEAFNIAKLADSNLTLKQFKNLINTDFQGAITVFLKGLREGGTTTTKFNALLGTLKLQSGEAKSVITTLAKNVELLGEKQAIASDQLERGTSLGEEAAIVNNTLAGSWNKLKNDVSNFFTSGTGASALKWFVDAARGALNLREGLGKTFGLVQEVSASQALLDATRKQVGATTDLGTAAGLAAAKAAELYQQYTALSSSTNRSGGQERQLGELALRVRDILGEKVAVIDRETGAYRLNTAAVEAAIKGQNTLKKAQAETLAKQLETVDAQLRAQKTLKEAKGNEVDSRIALLAASGVPLNAAEGLTKFIPRSVTSANVAGLDAPAVERLNITRPQIAALVALREANEGYGQAVQKVTGLESERAMVLAGLLKLGYSASEAAALLGQETEKTAIATDDSIEADKKKKKSVADVAKEEAALAKQRLSDRLADLTRQADNPANSEALRTEALKKAGEVRIEIARVERDELIREAAAKFKDQVNGEQALGVARTRFTEAFSAQRLGIERETNKAILTLHGALLDQLGELDKLTIAAELATLDAIVANEGRSFDERQQAAADASARRIELVGIEAEAQVRAAQGNATKIKAIRQKEADDTAAILKGTGFNPERANQAVAIDYEAQQTELEQARAKGLVTERGYEAAVQALHLGQLREELANLETGVDNEKAISAKKLEIAKLEGDKKVRLTEETERKKQDIIQGSLQTLGNISDAYFSIEAGNNQAAAENYQHQKQDELAVAGDNAELKAQIEEKFRKKELELKRKQAQQDKIGALFSIAINTAVNASEYTPANPLFYLALISGAAQAAVVAAKPLPAYFKGRRSGPAETALVAEQGPELIGQPGTLRVVARQGLTRLAAGDRVYTAPETRDVLRDHALVAGRLVARRQQADPEQQATALRVLSVGAGSGSAAEARAAVAARERENDRLIKAWHERPELRLTDEGLRRFTRRGDSWTEEVNSRYKNRS